MKLPAIKGFDAIIPEAMCITGEKVFISKDKTLVIDGIVETKEMITGVTYVNGTVNADEVKCEILEVRGSVTISGNLVCDKELHIRKGGKVTCDQISFGTVIIDRGGILEGTITSMNLKQPEEEQKSA